MLPKETVEFRACARTLTEMLSDRGYLVAHAGMFQPGCIVPVAWDDALTALFEGVPMWGDSEGGTTPAGILVPTPEGQPGRPAGSQCVLIMCVWRDDPPNHYVYEQMQPFLAADLVENMLEWPCVLPIRHVILLTKNPLKITDMKHLATLRDVRVECFYQSDLQFNKTHHEAVPRHHWVSQKEGLVILSQMNTDPRQAHRILATDPICKYFGGQVGDLFVINRHDPRTGMQDIDLRIVTK